MASSRISGMIKINFDKVADALASEEFKKELCEACKSSTKKHASELHKIPEECEEIDSFEYNVRADLVILRLMSLIAERICDGMDDEEEIEPKMNFIFRKSEYLFELLEKILSADELLGYMKTAFNSGELRSDAENCGNVRSKGKN